MLFLPHKPLKNWLNLAQAPAPGKLDQREKSLQPGVEGRRWLGWNLLRNSLLLLCNMELSQESTYHASLNFLISLSALVFQPEDLHSHTSVSTSVSQFSRSVTSDSSWPHGLQHTRPLCPSPTPGVYSNSCPLSQWCHPTTSSSVVPFFSCPQSFPASWSFPMSQLFALDGQRTGVSASTSVLSMNTQGWSPLGWTGWISFQFKGLSRGFSNTTVQKHQFVGAQLSF